MEITEAPLDGVKLIRPEAYHDHRGFFMESYSRKVMMEGGIGVEMVQDNHSFSVSAGTIRGLHYQNNPMAQSKLVRVTSGEILDVVVDIRKGSPTFGKWFSEVISSENKLQIFVPRGFAHGFCTLSDNAEVCYKVDQYYSKDHDRGIFWNDPDIGIQWPDIPPILSSKDKSQPLLKDAEINFQFGGI